MAAGRQKGFHFWEVLQIPRSFEKIDESIEPLL
jgi:hypothetical protein